MLCTSSAFPSVKRPRIAIIVAIGPKRVIGQGNQLPWKLPRDMKFFRRATVGHAIVMGRKTFQSLGCKPLPKRRNIVITRNPLAQWKNVDVVHSLEEAIRLASNEKRIFIIGGGEIYRAALPIADDVYITEITDQNPNLSLFDPFPGDTFFPPLDEKQWRLDRPPKRQNIASDRVPPIRPPQLKRGGLYFQILRYKKRHPRTEKMHKE